MWRFLHDVKAKRAAHAQSVEDARPDNEQQVLASRATDAKKTLSTMLGRLSRSRSKVDGDRFSPRKRSAGKAFAGSSTSSSLLPKLQSQRRIARADIEYKRQVRIGCVCLDCIMLTSCSEDDPRWHGY